MNYFHHTLPVGTGLLAVDFFFMMSGFVIAMNYDDRLLNKGMSFGEFFRRRLLRLYPAFLIGASIGALDAGISLALGSERESWSEFACQLLFMILMLPDPFFLIATSPFPMNPPAWSLSVEFWGNLVYACCAVRLGSRMLVATVLLAFVVYGLGISIEGSHELGVKYSDWNYIFGMPRFWFSFGVGVLIWRLRNHLPTFGVMSWPLIGIAMLFPILPNIIWLRTFWIVVLFPACIISALSLHVGSRMQGICVIFGMVSYPVYIIHFPILRLVSKVGARIAGPQAWTSPVVGAIAILVILVATVVTTFVLEPWVSKVMRKVLNRGNRSSMPNQNSGKIL